MEKEAVLFTVCQVRTLRHDVAKPDLYKIYFLRAGRKKFATRCRKLDSCRIDF